MKAFVIGLTCVLGAIARPAAAASCVPGFDFGAFGKSSVDYGGNSGCDAWNSSVASYATSHASGCNLGTDGIGSGAMTVHGTAASVFGNLTYGVGGTDATSLTIHGHPGYGTSGALASTLALPPVAVPITGTNLGACAGCAIAPNNTYTTVSGNVTFPAGTYVIGTLGANITVTTGSVVIYVTGSFSPGTITNGAPGVGIPGHLLFEIAPSVATISLTGLTANFAMYAPNTAVDLHGNGDIYGAIVANTIAITGTPMIHYDSALASLATGGFACVVPEISRSAPVVATLAGSTYIVQGSFESGGTQATITNSASVASWTFPYKLGHMRARLASSITVTGSTFPSGTVLFDAGATGKIPAANNAGCTARDGSCRRVFANTNASSPTGSTFHPAVVTLSDGTASTIGALITTGIAGITTANWQTIVRTVIAGKLGGVDRSTVAVIPPSAFAGVATRPTIAYFGATDGMVHAVCASTGGTTPSQTTICPSLGTELWAFLPRVQLPLIAGNTARVDGSIRVVDAFADLTSATATGTRSWHTILTFQTGFAVGGTAATYALDVTDPASPTLLWEYATPSAVGSTELGTGLTVAAGPALIGGTLANVAVMETNNRGTGGAGVVVTAVSQETGARLWAFSYLYAANTTRYLAADQAALASGVPGGAVGVDLTGSGYLGDFVLGDIFGDVWRLSASDGTSRNGAATPLFSFSTTKHPIGAPPTIYSNGHTQFAAFTSGGYTDPIATTWTTSLQYLIAVKLSSTAGTIDETTTACSTCALTIKQSLAAGDKGYSQAIVVGTQLFVTTDATDVDASAYGTATNTGHLLTVDLTTSNPSATTVVVNSGASSLVNSGTTLYSAGATQQQQLATAATTTTGPSVDAVATPRLSRRLWLRTE